MKRQKQVLVREVCPGCRGSGVVTHPAWEVYWEGHFALLEERALREWFASEGYGEIPPEEIPCPECGGRGHTERWEDIQEVRYE